MEVGTVPLYIEPPQAIVPEEVLQALGRARLHLLEQVAHQANSELCQSPFSTLEEDAVSHFLVRLVCCDGASRRWLLDAEEALLRRRLQQASASERLKALRAGVPGAESSGAVSLHFTQLPVSLLAGRRVLLRRGQATVQPEDFPELICGTFRRHLTAALVACAQKGPGVLEAAPPLKRAVEHLRPDVDRLLNLRDSEDSVDLRLSNFEEMLEKSMPPCMQYLVDFQREGKHLKHLGRLQLRPLLREAGLPLAEARRWWQREFLRDAAVTKEDFELEHVYHIEHAYGCMGKGKPAFAWSCRKTWDFPSPRADQAHGCPFKSLDDARLRRLLRGSRGAGTLSEAQVEEALRLREAPDPDGTCQERACAFVFSVRHPGAEIFTPKHPMEFLRRSRRYYGRDMSQEHRDIQPLASANWCGEGTNLAQLTLRDGSAKIVTIQRKTACHLGRQQEQRSGPAAGPSG
ncbi:unnamed protein product [Effrenium voratum]|uniref:DNA primase large subunit C-terminal domain-containing protein n=1 Tax=Effrenium voratum TaxID=2562239 RepID=A0AA36IXR2_9DINO|nr:unnamed protein product [Effrenium voratum]